MGKKYERVPLKNVEYVMIDGVKRVKNKKLVRLYVTQCMTERLKSILLEINENKLRS